jgi:hypothetical protein
MSPTLPEERDLEPGKNVNMIIGNFYAELDINPEMLTF